MCACVYIYIYIYIYSYTYIHIDRHIYIYIYVSMYVYIYIYTYIYIYACVGAFVRARARSSHPRAPVRALLPAFLDARVLPSFQQPTFQKFTKLKNDFPAAWSAFHLTRAVVWFVSSEVLKCRLLKGLLDQPMIPARPHSRIPAFLPARASARMPARALARAHGVRERGSAPMRGRH